MKKNNIDMNILLNDPDVIIEAMQEIKRQRQLVKDEKEQKEHAERTKAWIGSKREATAMNTASIEARRRMKVERKLKEVIVGAIIDSVMPKNTNGTIDVNEQIDDKEQIDRKEQIDANKSCGCCSNKRVRLSKHGRIDKYNIVHYGLYIRRSIWII